MNPKANQKNQILIILKISLFWGPDSWLWNALGWWQCEAQWALLKKGLTEGSFSCLIFQGLHQHNMLHYDCSRLQCSSTGLVTFPLHWSSAQHVLQGVQGVKWGDRRRYLSCCISFPTLLPQTNATERSTQQIHKKLRHGCVVLEHAVDVKVHCCTAKTYPPHPLLPSRIQVGGGNCTSSLMDPRTLSSVDLT